MIEHGLEGFDFYQLHARHIAFARDALFGPLHSLPGWYPRELLGAPFLANIQSFPWIPTRLVLLLLAPKMQFVSGVAMAAALAAIFTYLFCKRAGLSEIGAVSAGWTFSCAGFFASRVMSGELPMLEAYPSLPLLLWLADRAIAPDRLRFQVRDLTMLALGGACVALAGHPQLPAYSIGAAFLYLIVFGRGRRRILGMLSAALGVALTLFAWWPMFLLIQRSTRVLPLAPPGNDIAMPYGRLLSLISPGHDGWPEILAAQGQKIFEGYPNVAYFWDTVSYVGLVPLLAIVWLLIRCAARKRLSDSSFAFLAGLGIGALLLSLPFSQPLHHLVHGTFLRSPARLLYLSTFSACTALGCGVDWLLNSTLTRRAAIIIAAFILALHAVDLGRFDRRFVQPADDEGLPREFQKVLAQELGDRRIASEYSEYRDCYDDAGIYDSILLANPYRALIKLAGLPPDVNEQRLDASQFPIPALEAAGVRFVITTMERNDLELVSSKEEENLYRVPNPAPRAAFVAAEHSDPAPAIYSRPSSDEIRVETASDRAGYATVLESYDPGWSAIVDGAAARAVVSNGFAIAVPVKAGKHAIVLRYHTPGLRTGMLLSLASAALLIGLLVIASKNQNPA